MIILYAKPEIRPEITPTKPEKTRKDESKHESLRGEDESKFHYEKTQLSNTKSNEGITPVLLQNDTFNDTLREKNDTKFYKKAI